MNEVLMEVLRLAIMIIVIIGYRYLIPWIREWTATLKGTEIEKWVRMAVLAAQQVMQSKSGAERKAYVTQFLKELLTAKNISLTDEQIDVLIEAAVKQMKIEAGGG